MNEKLLNSYYKVSDVIERLYSEWTEQTEISMLEALETAYQMGRQDEANDRN